MPASLPETTAAHSHSITPALLQELAHIVGCEYEHERARIAVQNAIQSGTDPMQQLVAAGAEAYLRVSPTRLPLSELIWQARHDSPVLVWQQSQGRWLIITHAGWFQVRLATGDQPTQRMTVSRKELADMLLLPSIHSEVEAGIAQPERTAHEMSRHAHAEHEEHLPPLKRLWGLAKLERRDIKLLLLFSVFSGLLYLAAPLAVDAVVSNLAFGAQSQPYVQALVVLALALFSCLLLQAVVTGFQYYLSDVIQRSIFVRVSSDLAYRLPRVKAHLLDEVHAPELVNRFLEVVTVQKTAALLLLDGVNLVFGALIGMLLLALYHPLLLVFVLVLLALIMLIIWLFGRGAVDTSISESKMKYELVNWFESIAQFPFLFKGPGGYTLAYEKSNQLVSDYVTARAKHFRILMRQITGLLGLQVLAFSALLVLGGWLVISQQITLGQLVASELIMSSIVASLAKMGKQMEAWYDVMASMDKLGHVFDLEIEREDGEKPAQRQGGAELVGREVSFGYGAGAPLFESQNFHILPGARAAIVGAHGSGASSLLDILFGLRSPTAGFVSVDGLDLRSWYLEALREDVQLLRREEIVEGSVVENLRLGRPDVGLDEIRSALAEVGLLEELLLRPEGLNLQLKLGGAPLSGIQRTRLLLARALVQRPRLLLIDELLDGLDPSSFHQLSQAILGPEKPWTVVLVTRDSDVTQLCQPIIKLSSCHLTDGSDSTPSA